MKLVCWNQKNSSVGSKHEAQLLTESLSFETCHFNVITVFVQVFNVAVLQPSCFSLKEVYHLSFSKLVVGPHKSHIQC